MADKNSQTAPYGSTAASLSSALFTTSTRPSSSSPGSLSFSTNLSIASGYLSFVPNPTTATATRPSSSFSSVSMAEKNSQTALITNYSALVPVNRQKLPSVLATPYSTKPHFSSAAYPSSSSPGFLSFPTNLSIASGYLAIVPTPTTATAYSSLSSASLYSKTPRTPFSSSAFRSQSSASIYSFFTIHGEKTSQTTPAPLSQPRRSPPPSPPLMILVFSPILQLA